MMPTELQEAERLTDAVIVDPRQLLFRTPAGKPPLLVFDGHIVLKQGVGVFTRPDGSFQLKRPPVFQVKVLI